MPRRAELTDKQKLFINEYMIDLNATAAALRAGYAAKSAADIGYKNLNNPRVKRYIDDMMREKEDSLIAKQDEVLRYLTSVMRGESTSEVVVVVGEGDGYSSAKRVSKNPDEKERTRAAELLGKRYGSFTDRVEMDADTTLHIAIDYGGE